MLKKLLISLVCATIALKSQAIVLINVSQFPNITVPGTNYLILYTQPGVTNYNMNVLQFEQWLATDPNFYNQLIPMLPGPTWPTQTNAPVFSFTNTVAYWTTNASFTSAQLYNPFPIFRAELIVSNSANAKITNTLPFSGYSLSLGSVVSQAVLPTNGVLDLKVNYYGGTYYIEDYGKNNSTLYGLATNNVGSGHLVITNGVISIAP